MRTLVFVAVVGSLAFAPAPFPRTERRPQDLTDVAGTWRIDVWESRGEREENDEVRLQARVTKESFDLVYKHNGKTDNAFKMKLDPTLSPPAFTWSINERKFIVGSYRLRRDELTLIFNSVSRIEDRLIEDRPKDFGGKCDHRLVMRRISR